MGGCIRRGMCLFDVFNRLARGNHTHTHTSAQNQKLTSLSMPNELSCFLFSVNYLNPKNEFRCRSFTVQSLSRAHTHTQTVRVHVFVRVYLWFHADLHLQIFMRIIYSFFTQYNSNENFRRNLAVHKNVWFQLKRLVYSVSGGSGTRFKLFFYSHFPATHIPNQCRNGMSTFTIIVWLIWFSKWCLRWRVVPN